MSRGKLLGLSGFASAGEFSVGILYFLFNMKKVSACTRKTYEANVISDSDGIQSKLHCLYKKVHSFCCQLPIVQQTIMCFWQHFNNSNVK